MIFFIFPVFPCQKIKRRKTTGTDPISSPAHKRASEPLRTDDAWNSKLTEGYRWKEGWFDFGFQAALWKLSADTFENENSSHNIWNPFNEKAGMARTDQHFWSLIDNALMLAECFLHFSVALSTVISQNTFASTHRRLARRYFRHFSKFLLSTDAMHSWLHYANLCKGIKDEQEE